MWDTTVRVYGKRVEAGLGAPTVGEKEELVWFETMGVTRRTTKDMSRGRSHLLSSHSFSTDSRNRNRLPYTTERKPAIFRPLQGAPPPAPLYLPDLGVSSFKTPG
jgi:hypothetical protein